MDGHGRETFHFTRVCWVFSVNSISFHSAAPLTNMKHLMMHHVMKYYLRITLKHSFSLMSVFSFRYLKVSTILLVAHDWWRLWCTLYIVHDCYDIWQQRLVPKNVMYHQNTTNKQKSSPNSADDTIWYLDLSCQVTVWLLQVGSSPLLTVAAVYCTVLYCSCSVNVCFVLLPSWCGARAAERRRRDTADTWRCSD